MNYRPYYAPGISFADFELSAEDRLLLDRAEEMREAIDTLYRPKGAPRNALDRDSFDGWRMEFDTWFSNLIDLGKRISAESSDRLRQQIKETRATSR